MSLRSGVLCLLVTLGVAATPGVAHAQFEDAPDDILKILDRLRHGQQATAAEKQRIASWAIENQAGRNKKVQTAPGRRELAGAAKTGNGAPCYVTMTADLTVVSREDKDTKMTRHLHYQAGTACRVAVAAASPGNLQMGLLLPGATTTYNFTADPDRSRPGATAVFHGDVTWDGQDAYHCQADTGFASASADAPVQLWMSNFNGGDALFATGAVLATRMTSDVRTCSNNRSDMDFEGKWGPMALMVENHQLEKLMGGRVTPAPAMRLSMRQLDAALAAGSSLVGDEDFDFDAPDNPREHIKGHGKLEIRFGESPLVIEPVDRRAFEAWIPAPLDGKYAEDGKAGTPLEMRVSFGPGGAAGAGPLSISLDPVSQNLGTCTNAPLQPVPTYGLRFADTQPPGIHRVDDQHVDTGGVAVAAATVIVEARDTGAFGTLHAVSPQLGAKADRKIPCDDNGNDIADAWEKRADVAVFARGLPARWDGETAPDGPDTGDGLTLYEEYRGILISDDGRSEHFVRLSPNRKKEFFFVPDLGRAFGADLTMLVLAALKEHEAAANDKVMIFRLGVEVTPEPYGAYTLRRMNPNSNLGDKQHFDRAHHAVPIVVEAASSRTEGPATAETPFPTRYQGNTPALTSTVRLSLSPDDTPGIFLHPSESNRGIDDWVHLFRVGMNPNGGTAAWLREHGLTAEQMAKRLEDPAVRALRIGELVGFTVLHESGHTIHRHHHEDAASPTDAPHAPPKSCPMYYFNGAEELEFLGGYWNPSANGLVLPWPRDVKEVGWVKKRQEVKYLYCGGDGGAKQGGQGGPRYKQPQ